MSDRYRITISDVQYHDQAGNHTRSKITITDESTRKTYTRVGDGRQIGNFHPIWVNWHGSKITIEELSRIQIE